MVILNNLKAEIGDLKEFKVPTSLSMESCRPLSDYFTSALMNKEEGLVVKGALSLYSPAERDDWFKVIIIF